MAASVVRIFLTHSREAREAWYGARALRELRSLGEVVLNPLGRAMTGAELVEAARDCPLIVADRGAPGGADVFSGLPSLAAYIRGQVDIRMVDIAAASAAGVLVTQTSRGFMAAVAEWIIGAMLAAARSSIVYIESYRRGEEPGFITGRQLSGSTIGVIGFGAIAEHLCKIAKALGMRVVVHDPYKTVPLPFEQVELTKLLAEADFVVPLAVATAETENLIDAERIAAMKPTAWLINASRGNLVDEEALESALDARQIAGAALDVGRAPDQKPPLRLARRGDVIASPHIAGLTPEALDHQALETVRQAAAIIRGEVPEGAVNADRATRLARFGERMMGRLHGG
jgi:D-3-phosphoglycerate dehydrogenase